MIYRAGEEPYGSTPDKGRRLARKRFFLSTCPFELDKVPNLGQAPTRRSYYTRANASPQLISWLETNNCDTIYCRELKIDEVTCRPDNASCVPEFVKAYQEALRDLKNEGLARRWITNYAPLNSPQLSVGFYEARRKWLEGDKGTAGAIRKIEERAGLPAGSIKSTMTDKAGVAYFFDLCPGRYYISSIAPVEIDGETSILWETVSFLVGADEEPPIGSGVITLRADSGSPTAITLANVPSSSEDDNDFIHFAGKKVSKAVSSLRTGVVEPGVQ